MGLQPLEFSDCLTDSPYFREKLHTHEKELERTSKAIKNLINECKDLLAASRTLSKAQKSFADCMKNFKFECIGSEQTDEEILIGDSLKEFGTLIYSIEDERDKMLERAVEQIVHPLEKFRKEEIGSAKEGKKKFDKQTAKFCQSLEKYLNMKASKVTESQLAEADAALEFERRHFYQASMQYVLLLQEVQERKKFEFVETLLSFMYSWLTFYHSGHEVSKEFRPYMTDLQLKLQKTRNNFETTHSEAETLMNRMLEVRGTKPQDNRHKTCTREGYLYMMEKKALGTTWSKYYCLYQKENKILTMIPYNQEKGKGITTETMVLASCTRRAADSIDKRFCFDITIQDKTGQPITLQSLSEEDRRLWLDAMDGKEPVYAQPSNSKELDSLLDDIGFTFIKKCISAVERKGIEEQGIYRVVGVNSKVAKLTNMGLDRRKADKIQFEGNEWELKTITSAIKNYFRSLPEPIMTFKLHYEFIAAAQKESKTLRINDIHELLHKIPEPNFEMLDMLIAHLKKVSENSNKNLMTVGNIGVCFGPTLMRPEEETMAAIMDIKFCNLVVEILIENYEKMFKTKPEFADINSTRVLDSKPVIASPQSTTSNSHQGVPPMSASQQSFSSNGTALGVNSSRESTPTHSSAFPMSSSMTSSTSSSSHIYANQTAADTSQTYAQYRAKLRPAGGIYSQYSPGDQNSSRSSSTESLNSKCSASSMNASASQLLERRSSGPTTHGSVAQGLSVGSLKVVHLDRSPQCRRAINRFSQPGPGPAVSRDFASSAGYGFRKRQSADSLTFSISSTSSASSVSSGPQPRGRKVRTLYSCEAENDSELSFEPNQIITNVRPSREPGWLEGSLDGKAGLIPANYVEYLN